jgi:hypothetical protein
VTLENEHLHVCLLPEKGAEIVELVDARTMIDVMWHWRPLRLDDGTLGQSWGQFAEWYSGGWPEVIPNGDMACVYRGINHEPAGEAWRRAWDCRATETAAELTVELETLPLVVTKRLALLPGASVLSIEMSVQNRGKHPVELLWNVHPTIGAPLLAPGSCIDVPPCRVEVTDLAPTSRFRSGMSFVWPRLPTRQGEVVDASIVVGPEQGSADLLLLHSLSDGWAAIRNHGVGLGFGIRWDQAVFPRLWLWQGYGGDDPPWNDCYALAIEPAVGTRTLTDSAGRGEVLALAPGQRISAVVEASTFLPQGRVTYLGPGGLVEFEA